MTIKNYLERLAGEDYPIGENLEIDEREYATDVSYCAIVNRVEHHFRRMQLIPTQLRNRTFEFYLSMSRFMKMPFERRLDFYKRYRISYDMYTLEGLKTPTTNC